MSSGGAARPKPAPPLAQQRWCQERRSQYPWEQDGLDHIKWLMPDAEPYRAWATFSFVAATGRVNECDLLIAVPGGLYLVELKGHPGHVVNSGNTWSFTVEGAKRPRTLRNPLTLTDMKCKDLKGRLEWAAKGTSHRVPWVQPAIFLSAPGLVSGLDEVQRTGVYGRDGDCKGLPGIWNDLLTRPPQQEDRRLTAEFSREVLPLLLERIGIRASTAHLRFGDDWTLDPSPLDAGPTWEDRLAQRKDIVAEEGRVRIYLTEQQATDARRQSVERAARREYQVLQGIAHRGIAQAVQIQEHQGGPAILFRHGRSDEPLDSYLAVLGKGLATETRLDMVRQLAEAVRYAHSRSLYHRALAARSVYVSARDDGSEPVLRVIDWQSAARDFETAGLSSLGNTSLTSEHLASASEVYLAPEFDTDYPDPADLDVFGLGALAYLIITGQPPASDRAALVERLWREHGLHPYAVSDSISDRLDELVFAATRTEVPHRLESAEAFLAGLDAVEQDALPEQPAASVLDPLQAVPGQAVDGDWVVERVLGTGATARALLVSRTVEDEDGQSQVQRRVFKAALDDGKAARLRSEADALRRVGGGVIAQLLDGPRELAGRTVLDVEYAGGDDERGQTLGAWLRDEGKLPYHDLERFGGDVFRALDQLAMKGVPHRDIKPDNFGIYRRADRSRQLILFDFSLADASERDTNAGTRGYRDPFLGSARRPVFDDHAERYAAAVTLHEMASARKPVWGDGQSDPLTTGEETPAFAEDGFDAALREGLHEFFVRALHRDTDRRFDTSRQMEDAWRAVFAAAATAAPLTTPATVGIDLDSPEETWDAYAAAATLDTPLEAAGLGPNAVSVAGGFGATTVAELLEVPRNQIAVARGAGARVRKELNRRHQEWKRRLHTAEPARPEPRDGAVPTIDTLAEWVTPKRGRKGSSKAAAVRLALGLPDGDGPAAPWPTQAEVAAELGISQASVSHHLRGAAKEWAGADWLRAVRDELVELVTGAGRVMTAAELAGALRAGHGALEDDPELVRARALAVVRAGAEAEMWAGMHPPAGDNTGTTEVTEPRLAVLRREHHVLIVCESLSGSTEPSAPELADYARRVGVRADELVADDPLPGRGAVVRELRAVPTPEGMATLADTRLVALAAAVSQAAAASPRLELYPRELDLVRALRISQAAAGVRAIGITPDELLAKVRARFPELALDQPPTPVRLEGALREAGFTLVYDTAEKRFLPPVPEQSRRASTSVTGSSGNGPPPVGLDPIEVLGGKLEGAVERGGFVALTLRGTHLPGAAESLAARFPVRSVDVDGEFLSVFRALVAEYGQDWNKVVKSDARFGQTAELRRGLASYVRRSWEAVHARLAEQTVEQGTVLLLHRTGLLARYFDAGGREVLTGLQQAARRPEESPHGLWLLCPGESARDSPRLGTHIVEVTDGSERVVLTREFLHGLRGEPEGAA